MSIGFRVVYFRLYFHVIEIQGIGLVELVDVPLEPKFDMEDVIKMDHIGLICSKQLRSIDDIDVQIWNDKGRWV